MLNFCFPLFVFFSAQFADASCESLKRDLGQDRNGACALAKDAIETLVSTLAATAGRIRGRSGAEGATQARAECNQANAKFDEHDFKEKIRACESAVVQCRRLAPSCTTPPNNLAAEDCENTGGAEKDRTEAKTAHKAECEKIGRHEKDQKTGGKGDGKPKDEDKQKGKGEGGGEGGGLPDMKPPEKDDKKKQDDPSCSGQTPGPGCAPKDDPCAKDANSMACQCQGDGPKPEVCFRKSEKTKVHTGDDSGDVDSGGSLVNSASIGSPADRSSGGARGSTGGSGGFGGGGSGSGVSGLKPGGGSTGEGGSKSSVAADQPKAANAGSGGGGGGGGGGFSSSGSSFSSNRNRDPRSYEKLAAQGAAIAHRRMNGLAGEIGNRHSNIFENINRAYKSYGPRLVKASGL